MYVLVLLAGIVLASISVVRIKTPRTSMQGMSDNEFGLFRMGLAISLVGGVALAGIGALKLLL